MHWFGARRATTGGHPLPLSAWPVVLVVFVSTVEAQSEIAHARAAARAGIATLSLPDSPGAPASHGARFQVAGARPYCGSGLIDAAVRVCAVGRRLAAALAWAQRSSDIHREHAATASLQLRTSRWRAGAGAHLQRRAFEAYEPRWVYDVRLGAGFTLGRHAVVLRATPRSFESNGARLDVALRVALHREVTLDFQHTREPGLPLRLRGALSLRAPQFVLHSGYDLATRSAAAGFEAGPTRMRVVYAVRFHPDLAWSHTWMLEFGRASEALGLH